MRSIIRFLPIVLIGAVSLFSDVGRASDPAGEAAPKASAADRMASSRITVESVRAALGKSLAALEAARQERDVAKVNFISEKVIALKGLLRIAEQADVNLQEALLKHDDAAADHEEE